MGESHIYRQQMDVFTLFCHLSPILGYRHLISLLDPVLHFENWLMKIVLLSLLDSSSLTKTGINKEWTIQIIIPKWKSSQQFPSKTNSPGHPTGIVFNNQMHMWPLTLCRHQVHLLDSYQVGRKLRKKRKNVARYGSLWREPMLCEDSKVCC